MSFDRTEAIVNYEVGIIVNVTDDISGVQDGWAHIFDRDNNFLSSFKLLPNSINGLLEGTFMANEFWQYPVYMLGVTVRDNTMNEKSYRDSTDFTAPVLFKSIYTFPPGIYLSVTPFGGSSIVNAIVQFDIEVNSTFIHDMSNVSIVLEGIHDSGLVKHGTISILPVMAYSLLL